MAGPLRLGVIPTLGPYLLPHLVPQIRATYPKLKLYLREAITANLLEQLHAGELDVLLLALPVDEGLEVIELFREPFILAAPVGDPLTRRRRVRQSDLKGTHVLLLEDGHCLRNQALAVCGFQLPTGVEDFRASSLETLRQMVAAGVGCTLLPTLAASTPSPGEHLVELRPFATPVPGRTIGLVWRRSFPRGDTLRALATLIQAHLPPGVSAIANDDQDKSGGANA
jgi:LysR family hydrogen peroxide-inducible transcriptional activator